MQQAITFLRRLVGRPGRTDSVTWWDYFGGFGDDFFGDDHDDDEWSARFADATGG